MAVTPLYTVAELDAEIAAFKTGIKRLAQHQSIEVDGVNYRRSDLESMERHLDWLQGKRAELEIGSAPQAIQRRVKR